MSKIGRQGLLSKVTLDEDDIAEIEQLTTLCNSYENLQMRISPGLLRHSSNEINNFLFYQDDLLVGYLTLDGWGTKEKELMGMVHPAYRRKGIFRTLLAEARAECSQRGVELFVLVCEHASQAGLAFIQASGATYSFSEHSMALGTFQEKNNFDGLLQIRRAGIDDLAVLTTVQAASFGDDEEGVRRFIEKHLQKTRTQIYLATLGETQPVGILRLDEMEHEIGIYGFGVRPEYRRRGYGRQMLEFVIRKIQSESQKGIMLEVDTTNTNALALYLSLGFNIQTTYDYYDLQINN